MEQHKHALIMEWQSQWFTDSIFPRDIDIESIVKTISHMVRDILDKDARYPFICLDKKRLFPYY